MVLAHEFYCNNGDCDNVVEDYNGICSDCIDTISENSHHCCGCGEDMFVSTNGYCGTCWTEKMESELTREPLSWYNGSSRYCTLCDEWFVFSRDDEDQHCPSCRMYGYVRCDRCGKHQQNDDMFRECMCYECETEEIVKLRERIVFIKEKLATDMTPAQTADWNSLLDKAYDRLEKLNPPDYDDDDYDKMARN